MVVAHHATIMAVERLGGHDGIWRSGAFGVDIFFVISGFVMALSAQSLQGDTPALTFLKRRVERIVPLYWIGTTLKLILLLATPALAVNGVGSLWHIIASYLFLPSRNASGEILPVLVVGWTLIYEMLFYVLFAVALALRVAPLRVLVPTLGLLTLTAPFIQENAHPILTLANPIVLEFLYGVLLYQAYALRWKILPVAVWLAPFGLAFALWTPWGGLLRALVWGVPALLIVAAAIALEDSFGDKMPKLFLRMGDASYSIYLTHTFALPAVGICLVHLGVRGLHSTVIALLASLVLSVLLGELVYYVLETRIMRNFADRRKDSRLTSRA